MIKAAFNAKLFHGLKIAILRSSRLSGPTAIDRARLWREFHRIRLTDIREIWRSFIEEIDLVLDPRIQQHVNQKIFQSILLSIAEHDVDTHQSRKVTLTKDEENIIRYAAGYVPLALLRKNQKGTSEKSSQFLECLSAMAVDGNDASFETYTTEWITAIDRGGLFHVKDDAYLLFREIEEFTRAKLTSLLKSLLREDDRKKHLIQSTVADPCISRLWRALSADLEEN